MSAVDNVRSALQPLRQQLAEAAAPLVAQVKANRRLAIALALIPAILWGYLVMQTQQWVEGEVLALNRVRDEAARLERIAGDQTWVRRAREADSRRVELEGRLWRIETEGLARAEFQEWLLSAARKAGLGRPQVRLEANDSEAQRQSAYRPINASLSGDFSPETLQAFLSAVANEKRLIVINSMRISRQPLPRIDMVLVAYGLPAAAGQPVPAASPTGAPPTGMQAPGVAPAGTPITPPPAGAPPAGGAAVPPNTVVGPGVPPDIAAKLLNAPLPAAPPNPGGAVR